jgi:Cof subfamily protein (haloacid dehalogenase superfamily)
MGRKLLAMDLDGTAVCDDYSMGGLSKKAIESARTLGHIIVFVSGRRDIDMFTMGEDQWRVDYHILNNGGKILRCKDKDVLYNNMIEPEVSRELIDYCLNEDLQLQICSGLTWQVTCMTKPTMEYAKDVGVIPKVIRSLDETSWQEGLEGFMATRDWKQVAKYIDASLPQIGYVHSEPGCIDIMRAGISKWKGIEILANYLNIPHEDIITVGNYYNDIDMLQHSMVGIAVANSLEPVKAKADFVTQNDNNHDAVAEIIYGMLNHDYDVLAHERSEDGTVSDRNR